MVSCSEVVDVLYSCDFVCVVIQYATTLDNKTLYVSKLPSDPSQQEIAELFGKVNRTKYTR